jgi:hypothetical protein
MSRADSDPNSSAGGSRPDETLNRPEQTPPGGSAASGKGLRSGETGTSRRVDPSLLDQVLQNTLELSTIAPLELSELVDVGRRYFGQPLVAEPIGVELVEVILKHRMSAATSSPGERREMARQIADSLMEDAHCETRLRAFWDQLVEAAR